MITEQVNPLTFISNAKSRWVYCSGMSHLFSFMEQKMLKGTLQLAIAATLIEGNSRTRSYFCFATFCFSLFLALLHIFPVLFDRHR